MQTRQVNLEGTGEIQLRWLVREALRMRLDRVIVGEVRQEDRLDLPIASLAGCPACARSTPTGRREAIVKLCALPLLAGENVGHNFVLHTEQRPPGGTGRHRT
jgi:pilus assembly protein CpaF